MPGTALPQIAAEVFTAGLWQGLLVAATVAVCLRLLSRISSSARFIVWGIAFLFILTVPLLRLQTPAGINRNDSSAILHLTPIWGTVILSVWVALTLFSLARLLYQVRRTHHIWRNASPASVSAAGLALLQASGRRAELCTSHEIDSPCVIGFFSPRLLVPESLFAELSQPQLEHIILHECEHLRRYDDWINLAQKIILTLFPLNPALWVADRRLSLERELACDAGVVSRISAPLEYAHSLTHLAEHRLLSSRVALALSAWSHKSELSHRVHALIKPVRQLSPSWARSAFAALTLTLGGGAFLLAHAPRLVSFSNVPALSAASQTPATPASSIQTASVPVLYHSEAASRPHMSLLKATLPSAKPASIPITKPALKRNGSSQAVPAQTPLQQTPRVVRTKADGNSVIPSRPHRTTIRAYYITDVAPSYAAVPFGDGWLIVQL